MSGVIESGVAFYAVAKSFWEAGKMMKDVWKENKDDGVISADDVQSDTNDFRDNMHPDMTDSSEGTQTDIADIEDTNN